MKTQLSKGIRSSLENNRYRYLRGVGGGRGRFTGGGKGSKGNRDWVKEVKKKKEVNDITATSSNFSRFVRK